jgi:hypothetical protein
MRKITLLAVPLLVLGLFSLSADVDFTVSGSSTLTFGIDLDTNATGFKNESTVDLDVTLVDKQTVDSGTLDTDDLYAYIELKDFTWAIDSTSGSGNTTAPSVTAKLFLGPFTITTFTAPTVEVDYVAHTGGVDTAYSGSGGLTVAYDLDPVSLSLGVVSEADWDATGTQNDDNAYAFLGKLGVDIGDDADAEIAVAYAHEYSGDDIGLGGKATFDLGDVDTSISFDGAIPSGSGGIPWDVGAGLDIALSEDGKSKLESDLTMHVPSSGDPTVGAELKLTEGAGDDGSLAGLGASITVGLDDLTSASNTWDLAVEASYSSDGIKPYFELSVDSAGDTMPFTAGLELTTIDNLTTTLAYTSTNLTGDSPDKGDITAALKIAY